MPISLAVTAISIADRDVVIKINITAIRYILSVSRFIVIILTFYCIFQQHKITSHYHHSLALYFCTLLEAHISTLVDSLSHIVLVHITWSFYISSRLSDGGICLVDYDFISRAIILAWISHPLPQLNQCLQQARRSSN